MKDLVRRSPLRLEGFGLAPKPPMSHTYYQACVLLVQVYVRIVQSSDLGPPSEHQIKIRSSDHRILDTYIQSSDF